MHSDLCDDHGYQKWHAAEKKKKKKKKKKNEKTLNKIQDTE